MEELHFRVRETSFVTTFPPLNQRQDLDSRIFGMVPKRGPPAKSNDSRIDTWSSLMFKADSPVSDLFRSGLNTYCPPIRIKIGDTLSRLIRDRDPRMFTALCDTCLPCDHVPPFDVMTSGGKTYDPFNIARWFLIDALFPHIGLRGSDDFMPGASFFTILSALAQFQNHSSEITEVSIKLDQSAYQSVIDRLSLIIALTPSVPNLANFESMLNGECYTKVVTTMMTEKPPYYNGVMPLYGFVSPELAYLLRMKLLLHMYIVESFVSSKIQLPQIEDTANDGRRIDVNLREQTTSVTLNDFKNFLRDEKRLAEIDGSESDIVSDYSSADTIIRVQFETFGGELPAYFFEEL